MNLSISMFLFYFRFDRFTEIFFYTIGTLVSIVRYLSIYLYNSMNLFLFFFRFEHFAEIFSYPIYIIEKSNSAL